MRILVATDAWHPQVNGVVRTLEETARAAVGLGATIDFVTPQDFATFPLPGYPEIRLALASSRGVRRVIEARRPDFVHIATEGPIGVAARRVCLDQGRAFTTSYHTHFPDYVRMRVGIPLAWSYAWLRRFHGAGQGTMVANPALGEELARRGFRHLVRWGRGVDTDLFHPRADVPRPLPRPVFLSVGRLALEKNVETFLHLDLPGSKLVVGDGPQLESLRRRFPAVHFVGKQRGEDLAQHYAAADVFVFPSLTDTFGIVVLEALASGLPVAAFPVMGPREVLTGTGAGVLADDLSGDALRRAALACLDLSKDRCRHVALRHGWTQSTRQFLDNVQKARRPVLGAA